MATRDDEAGRQSVKMKPAGKRDDEFGGRCARKKNG